MTYSQKIAALTDVQGQLSPTNALPITDGDVYREAWSLTVAQIAQKISSLWPRDF